jgi:hypothetical protein
MKGRVHVDAAVRMNRGPKDSVAAQLPVKRQAYVALTLAF